MPLSLFLFSPKTHLVGEIVRSAKFTHTFGGTCEQFDLRIKNSASNFHLIYRIDLSDPAIPIKIPGVEFLPLLYCFAGQLECSYLVLPDNQVKIFQGEPVEQCKNPACEKSDPEATEWMNALAIQSEPVSDELIWPDEFVQTIWMTCPACGSITALNRL